MPFTRRCVYCLAALSPDSHGEGLYHEPETEMTVWTEQQGVRQRWSPYTVSGSSAYGSLFPVHYVNHYQMSYSILGDDCPGLNMSLTHYGFGELYYVSV